MNVFLLMDKFVLSVGFVSIFDSFTLETQFFLDIEIGPSRLRNTSR